jgi:iron complex outermembrane receptor protein
MLVLGMASPAVAQQALLSGTVSGPDGLALFGVNVTHAPGQGVATGVDGTYALELGPGAHTVTFTSIGFQARTEQVTLAPGEARVLHVALDPATAQLDMVVVSAGRFEQRVGEVTRSLSVLRPELLRNKNVTSLDQALDQVPGLVIVDEEPQLRAGSGFSYGAGSRVQVLVDDIPILSGDIGRPNWSFLPIESVEQVEVIKGASSVLYGSAALSGVINVRTAYPRATPVTRVTTFTGIHDRPGQADAKWWSTHHPMFGGASFLHARQYGRLDLVLGGNAFSDGGYIGPEVDSTGTPRGEPGGYDQRVRFNTGLRWRSKVPGLAFGVNANAMKGRSSSVFLWDDIGSGLFRPEPGTVTHTEAAQYYVDPYVTYHGPGGFRHSVRTRLHGQEFINTGDQSNRNRTLHGEYQVQRAVDLLGRTVLTAGAVARHVRSDAELYRGNTAGDGRNEALNLAAYLQADKQLFKERLALSAGVRHEQFDVDGAVAAQPVLRAGATWRALEATYLRGSYGQGFRFPTIAERYIATNVGRLRVFPNPDLEAERSWDLEGGIKQGFRIGGFTGYVDAVAFRQEYDRYVEFTFGQWAAPSVQWVDGQMVVDLGIGFKSVNTGGARVTGLELELVGQGRIGRGELTVLMGYTRSRPVSTTPDHIYARTAAGSPTTYRNTSLDTTGHLLKFRITELFRADVQYGIGRVFAGASVRHHRHPRNIDRIFVDLDESGTLPTGVGQWMRTHRGGDLLVDARAGMDLSAQVRVSLVVNNLTNVVYALRPLAIEAPRSYQAVVALRI